MLASDMQFANAIYSIEVTLSGIITLTSDVPLNALKPIEVTLSGIVLVWQNLCLPARIPEGQLFFKLFSQALISRLPHLSMKNENEK